MQKVRKSFVLLFFNC